MSQPPSWHLACVECGTTYLGLELRYRCDCSATLDVIHDLDACNLTREILDSRLASKNPLDRSGVWRFRELILPLGDETLSNIAVTRGEGSTQLYDASLVGSEIGLSNLWLKHEGENPTGSFKDRGMTAGITIAKHLGMKAVACASTGNTSASMASYAAISGLEAIVFIPEGKIAFGKLSQALAYGAKTIQIEGDFDDAMALVQEVCASEGIYLVNSINPFRIEGQKAIVFEIMQDLDWQVPDWIVLPGGNLGNNTAISKGLLELHALNIIDRLPRIAVVQAAGANPLYTAWAGGENLVPVKADTIATAIKIGSPVSWRKSMRGIEALDGVVTEVSDDQIMDAKALVDATGIGAEPASCATVAGIRRLVDEGVIKSEDKVVGVLTGHLLKDPDVVVKYHTNNLEGIKSQRANAPISASADIDEIRRIIRQ
ncbi:MAG: threonine synthase [Candidatus Thalassarchaeaceae archaeon]|nr:threonine synthase [Candidatus Thalassarchaeaceae archaeon]